MPPCKEPKGFATESNNIGFNKIAYVDGDNDNPRNVRDPTLNPLWTKLKESIIMNGSKFRISSLVKTDDKVQLSCQAWHGQNMGNLRQEYHKICVNSIMCGKSKTTQCRSCET